MELDINLQVSRKHVLALAAIMFIKAGMASINFRDSDINFNSPIDLNNNKIENVADPTNPGDVPTKEYVDQNSGGKETVHNTIVFDSQNSETTYQVPEWAEKVELQIIGGKRWRRRQRLGGLRRKGRARRSSKHHSTSQRRRTDRPLHRTGRRRGRRWRQRGRGTVQRRNHRRRRRRRKRRQWRRWRRRRGTHRGRTAQLQQPPGHRRRRSGAGGAGASSGTGGGGGGGARGGSGAANGDDADQTGSGGDGGSPSSSFSAGDNGDPGGTYLNSSATYQSASQGASSAGPRVIVNATGTVHQTSFGPDSFSDSYVISKGEDMKYLERLYLAESIILGARTYTDILGGASSSCDYEGGFEVHYRDGSAENFTGPLLTSNWEARQFARDSYVREIRTFFKSEPDSAGCDYRRYWRIYWMEASG